MLTIPAAGIPKHFCGTLNNKNILLPMNTTNISKTNSRQVRYIAIADSTAKSCSKLKLLLKNTSYYCLVDCYRNSNELAHKESFYLPDCVILEVRSLYSLFSINKKMQKLQETIPGIKLVLYYNMLRRYPLLEQRNNKYPGVFSTDDEQKQVSSLEDILRNES
jgi:hypothetical protein